MSRRGEDRDAAQVGEREALIGIDPIGRRISSDGGESWFTVVGVTRNAARALGRDSDIGTIELGKWCDLAVWDIERPAELAYRIGFNPLHSRVWRGQ
mgnify:CR=1 FL=1